MVKIRPPACAGTFYPGEANALRREVQRYLDAAEAEGPAPKAVIVPHAGYVYSAAVAATAYRRLLAAPHIRRVILIGPAHRLRVAGLAASSAEAFATPLGNVPVDREAVEQACRFPFVQENDAAHEKEHCLEVQLPFLQTVLADFSMVPLLAGAVEPSDVAAVLEELWGGDETLIVISSDLSHYHDYETAQQLDQATSTAIEALAPQRIQNEGACGRLPIKGLLEVARQKGLAARTLDLRNSGDTAGPRDQVVGYGAYVMEA